MTYTIKAPIDEIREIAERCECSVTYVRNTINQPKSIPLTEKQKRIMKQWNKTLK